MLCLHLSTLLFFATNLSAQKGIAVAGGNITSINGSVSYSVGQVFYMINETTNTIYSSTKNQMIIRFNGGYSFFTSGDLSTRTTLEHNLNHEV
jgi:hypothetical protein